MYRFLVIYNIAKPNNIRDLCCTAAGHKFEVLCVGGHSTEGRRLFILLAILMLMLTALGISWLIDEGLEIQFFRKIRDCKKYLDDLGVPLIGIEIMQVFEAAYMILTD